MLLSACTLAACADDPPNAQEADRALPNEPTPIPAEPVRPAVTGPEREPKAERQPLIGEEVVLAEWRKAANSASCAPLALTGNGGVLAKVRRADFSQGWGVAFDSPRRRSAYGIAGAGPVDQNRLSHAEKRQALADQWPHTRAPASLPAGSFAGYGLMGAQPFSGSNPQGRGEHSLAYLRIPGQSCLYNVWSRISREHLETILDSLRLVETD